MKKQINSWWWIVGSITLSAIGLVGIGQCYHNQSSPSTVKLNSHNKQDSVELDQQLDDVPITYTEIDNGVLKGFKPNVKLGNINLSIPHQYESNKIDKIAENAFSNRSEIETVWIEEGISEIGSNAFMGCKNLKSVIIPNSVNKIGPNAFNNCPQLGVDTIVSSSRVLFDWWVKNKICRDQTVKTVKLDDYKNSENQPFKIIGEKAFANCEHLQEIVVGDSVEEIENQAFNACLNLKSVVLPLSVNKIGVKVFDQCPCLNDGGLVNHSLVLFDWWFKNHRYQNQPLSALTSVDLTIYKNSSNQVFTTIADATISFDEPNLLLNDLTISSSIHTIGKNNFRSTNVLKKLVVLSNNLADHKNFIQHVNTQTKFYVVNPKLKAQLVTWGISQHRIHQLTSTLNFYMAGQEEIVGLTPDGQNASILIIPEHARVIDEHAFGGSRATVIDFSKIKNSDELRINGKPFRYFNGEIHVKDKTTMQHLLKAGVNQQKIKQITSSSKATATRWLVASLVTLFIFIVGLGVGIPLYRRYMH